MVVICCRGRIVSSDVIALVWRVAGVVGILVLSGSNVSISTVRMGMLKAGRRGEVRVVWTGSQNKVTG